MKPVKVMFDEVPREGRSAVVRRATAQYLHRHPRGDIEEAYRRAFAEAPGLGDEFAGWMDEGAGPET